MIDLDRLRRIAVFAAMGAVAMATLLPCLALMRDTTAHDWYAARKLTLTQFLIGVGFDRYEPTDYRLPDGRVVIFTRDGVATFWPAERARNHIFGVIGDHALMGACAGLGGTVLLMVAAAVGRSRRSRTGAPVRPAWPAAAGVGRGYVEGLAGHEEDGARVGLLVVPVAEIERVADVLGHADLPQRLPAAGSKQGTVKRTPALPPADARVAAATEDEAGAGSAADRALAKPDPGRARQPPQQVPRPPRKRTTAEGGGAGEPRSPTRPKPDCDWF